MIIKYSKEKALRIVSKYDKDTIYVMKRIADYVKKYSEDDKRFNAKLNEDIKQYVKNV